MSELFRSRTFWKQVEIKGQDDCWFWQYGVSSNGYGMFWTGSHTESVHRYAWQDSRARAGLDFSIPKGKMVLHKCNNKLCVNPNHLYLGDGSDNMMDRINAGYVHSNLIHCKLYDEDVEEIRFILKTEMVTREWLAKMFGISTCLVSLVRHNPKFLTKGPRPETIRMALYNFMEAL